MLPLIALASMKLIIFIFTILLFSCCSGQLEESKRPTNNESIEIFSVKNVISNSNPNYGPDKVRYQNIQKVFNVQKGIETGYSIDKITGEVKFDRVDSTIIEYHKNGTQISYMNIGNRCFKFNYKYDSQNRNTNTTSTDCKGNIQHRITKIYTDSSIIIKSGDSDQYIILYTLDSIGNKLKREDYYDSKNAINYWIKKYDNNKNVIDFKFFAYDSLEFHQTYQYDKGNVLLSSSVLKFPEDLTDVYDGNGELMVSYSGARVKTFSYDEINNTIQETRQYDSKDSTIMNYVYDEFGNILETNYTTKKSKKILSYFRYSYDKFGNITEETSFWEGKPSYLSKYQYEYYK
jgi:hypothetical protein